MAVPASSVVHLRTKTHTPSLQNCLLAAERAARDDARLIATQNPGLKGARGEALRILLYLFERDAAVKYAAAG